MDTVSFDILLGVTVLLNNTEALLPYSVSANKF